LPIASTRTIEAPNSQVPTAKCQLLAVALDAKCVTINMKGSLESLTLIHNNSLPPVSGRYSFIHQRIRSTLLSPLQILHLPSLVRQFVAEICVDITSLRYEFMLFKGIDYYTRPTFAVYSRPWFPNRSLRVFIWSSSWSCSWFV
jgi:hypothetical protein